MTTINIIIYKRRISTKTKRRICLGICIMFLLSSLTLALLAADNPSYRVPTVVAFVVSVLAYYKSGYWR